MCGIAGFFLGRGAGLRQSEADALLDAMGGSIAHRGPDDEGRLFVADAGLGLAHRRLSIIDTSSAGRQPMTSACGRYVVVYNGELYNFLELKAELEEAGRAPGWKGGSDTEVVLAAFSEWGVERALQRFNGMFALALWDRAGRRLTLARDIAGEKPLYYAMVRGSLVFGSELRALAPFPGFAADIDAESLGHLLHFLAIPSPRAIFRGVRKLPPGQYLTLAREDLDREPPSPRTYWSASEHYARARADEFAGDPAEAVLALDALLKRSIRRRIVSDVPLGAFLSGGFDSTLVVALMQAQLSQPVRTFTIGFDDPNFDESPHARAIARHLGTAHVEARVSHREALEQIIRLPSVYDEPLADASQVPTSILCAMARRELTVALSGDAGDELFAGYQRYFATAQYWSHISAIPVPLRRLLARGYAVAARSLPRFASLQSRGLTSLLSPDVAQKISSALGAPDERRLYEALLAGNGVGADVLAAAAGKFEPPRLAQWNDLPGDVYDKMMFMDFVGYLPDDILVKVDRAAMAVGLETRVPFLDPEVIAFAWRLPSSMKLQAGRGKLILRKLVDRYVPAELMERPKQGFGLPIGDWLRGPLRAWAEELLTEGRIRSDGFFDPVKVRALWDDHLTGGRNSQPPVWPVLVFNAWLDSVRSAHATIAPTAQHS